jgi:hypothetical protein
MKIQLDFEEKKLTVEDNVNIGELVEKIKHFLPDWKKWTLETKTQVIWNNPIYIDRYWQPWWEISPPYYSTGTARYDGNNNTLTLCNDSGVATTFTGKGKVQYEIN